MEIIKEFLNDTYKYDSLNDGNYLLTIDLGITKIAVNYNSLIKTQFTGGNISDRHNFQKIKDFLKLGKYSKAPCGGFINFFQVKGEDGNEYVIFSGVNEVSNSFYIVTIHKVLTI